MFFRIFLIFLVVYLVIRFFNSLLRPAQSRGGATSYTKNQSDFSKREGEVTIIKKPSSSQKKITKEEGDYIDYEEV